MEALYEALSPEGKELLEEIRTRTDQTGGEIPQAEMQTFADRAIALPDPTLFREAVALEHQHREQKALLEKSEGAAAIGGYIGVIDRAAELAGRDPQRLTVGEAVAILKRHDADPNIEGR